MKRHIATPRPSHICSVLYVYDISALRRSVDLPPRPGVQLAAERKNGNGRSASRPRAHGRQVHKLGELLGAQLGAEEHQRLPELDGKREWRRR